MEERDSRSADDLTTAIGEKYQNVAQMTDMRVAHKEYLDTQDKAEDLRTNKLLISWNF